MDKSKAVVSMGESLNMNLILPVQVTDDMVMASTYRAEMQTTGRIGVPKNIRAALGLAAGDEVDVTVRPVKDREEK